MRLELESRWGDVLRQSPEAGMGYWIATVRLVSGEVFPHVVIDSGFVVDVPGYAGIPFTNVQIASIEVTNDKSKYSQRELTRYWFPLPSHFGIGVTAYSLPEARHFADATAENFHWSKPDAAIENVDVRTLDQTHVVPNMGPVNVRGVWYPMDNI